MNDHATAELGSIANSDGSECLSTFYNYTNFVIKYIAAIH